MRRAGSARPAFASLWRTENGQPCQISNAPARKLSSKSDAQRHLPMCPTDWAEWKSAAWTHPQGTVDMPMLEVRDWLGSGVLWWKRGMPPIHAIGIFNQLHEISFIGR
jgi:hypothetical protein